MKRRGRRGDPSARAARGARAFLAGHWALVAVFVVLVATTDDRFPDRPSDSWLVIKTAIALAETGELGIAAGPEAPRAFVRPEGDAVSRYGMGMSLAQVPAALAAPFVERGLGRGRSLPLFLFAPFLFVLAAAWLAGVAARLLGASDRGVSAAVLLAGLGSPLGSYAAWSFSESLQAAALAAAFAASLAATPPAGPSPAPERARSRALLLSCFAGLGAGTAILAKSSLLIAAPLTLLPLLAARPGNSRGSRLGAAAAGAFVPIGAWLAFEIVRFGAPFTSYGGEGFTHPFLDGAWRLLVGPNKGLLFFFPAFVLALLGIGRTLTSRAKEGGGRRLAALSGLGVFVVLLATSSTWWSWHGMAGWGPRFLVPAVPLLAAWAGVWLDGVPAAAGRALVATSILLNVPPLLVHPSLVESYMGNMSRVKVDAGKRRNWPDIGIETTPDGGGLAPPIDVLAEVPSASGHVVYPWFFRLGFLRDDASLCRRLEAPPWIGARPDLGPRLVPVPPQLARVFVLPARWNFLGRSFLSAPVRSAFEAEPTYLAGLADQVVRAQGTGRLGRALALAEKHAELSPSIGADPLVAESLRLLGRRDALQDLFGEALSRGKRASPSLLVVYALWARDRSDEAAARQALAAVARSGAFPDTPVETAVDEPISAWPADLRSMTAPSGRAPETLRPALPSFRPFR